MPRSDIVMVTWRSDSGRLVQKSQLVLGLRRLVRGSRLTAWLRSMNFLPSRKKKTGVLLPTTSQLPSEVKNRMAKPRMSRSASAAPRSPATVEKRMKSSHWLPSAEKIAARVSSGMERVTVKVPQAPEPLACMRRSGMTSRLKWACFSSSQASWRATGPRGPAVMESWLL